MSELDVARRTPILVTGATGSTGHALWQSRARRGIPARAMVRRESDVDRLRVAMRLN